ncbi:MAG TPA: CHAT domain-containing tetratricopeptide repeat protein [Pyrinomonadaceae bacterium]|nr:CHAT domain-containing tetratricopeptide repeat protein [Pyrinomonadaceae bacterium]
MLPHEDAYFRSRSQSWRDKGTLAVLTLKLKFFSTSLGFSREALDFARQTWPGSGRVNDNLLNLVRAAAAKGDFGAALGYAEESKLLALARPASPENTRTTAEVFLLLADVKGRMNDCEAALADYDRARELYGRLPEISVGAYRIHKGRLLCFRQLGRREEFAAELKTVLGLSEEYRMRLREDDSRKAFFAEEQVVFDEGVASAVEQGDARDAFALVETSRARSLLDFVESDKPAAELEREFASVARPLAPEEIRARLPGGAQLVEFAVLPDRLAVWVVSRDRLELFEKPVSADELEKKIDAYQSAVLDGEPAHALRRAAQELYALLLPPGLDAAKQLCIVPDKSLHRLAFASLVSPSGKYLVEEFALTYAPSASVFVLATENAARKGRAGAESILSVGNPDFDREENPGLADLRAAEAEARAVAAGYVRSQLLLGGDATREKFLRLFGGVEVVHFAGHFVSNRRSPGNSKLLFAGGELRSHELGAYKLPAAKLVVLSACETAFERYDKSEGAVGVARTFLALGAPVVIASQWQVGSEPTKDLMIAFHRNRTGGGMTSAEALRRAQLELLGRGETSAPFYWAAFSLFGGYASY